MGLYNATKKVYHKLSDKPKEDPEISAARDKGYREGSLERAEKEGRERAKHGGDRGSPRVGFANALGGSINNTERSFGFSNGLQIGGGLDFGLGGLGGGGSKPAAVGPTTERIIKKDGTVIVRQYGGGQQANKKRQGKPSSPYAWFDEADKNNFLEI
jgi:hypothetical protein